MRSSSGGLGELTGFIDTDYNLKGSNDNEEKIIEFNNSYFGNMWDDIYIFLCIFSTIPHIS